MHLFHDCQFASATSSKFLPQTSMHHYELFFKLGWQDSLMFNLGITLALCSPVTFAIVIWHIWCYRKKCVFDKVCTRPALIWHPIFRDIANMDALQDHLFNIEQQIISLKPPVHAAYKININVFQMRRDPSLFATQNLNGFLASFVGSSLHASLKYC